MFRLLCLAAAAALLTPSALWAQLRVVTYNTLDKPFTATDEADVRTIFGAIAATERNGVAKRPDIIALQEQTTFSLTDSTASRIAEELNSLFGVGTYVADVNGFGADRLAVVYDAATVELSSELSLPTAGPRPTQRLRFRPVGYDTPENDLYLYNSHLDAGDVADRISEANAIRGNANALGADANVIYLGDLNIGSSGEQTYANYLAAGAAQAFDPIQLPSFPSFSVAEHLTQSTRTTVLADEGAGGGLDDRFDFQLVTDDLLDGEGLTYLGPSSAGLSGLEDSYQAFGNDGVSFNNRINNTFVNRSQSSAVLNALHDFSDHLPVVADYQLPALLAAEEQFDPEQVIELAVGEALDLSFLISNAAPVDSAVGADELDYELTTSGQLSGGAAGSVMAAGDGQSIPVTLDTSTPGEQSGVVTITSSSQGEPIGSIEFDLQWLVVEAVGQPGDFNNDGVVDAADYTVWRDNLGSDEGDLLNGNGNGGTVDTTDYDLWVANFGAGGSAGVSAAAVPEPVAVWAAGLALLAAGAARRR